MARIIDDKLLFIHVAKTGGTFVREAFNYFGIPNKETGDFETEDHYSLTDVIKAHPVCSRYISFGYIRHPVEWIQSRWLWAMETNFQAKIKYNDEAKDHWMAPVFSTDVNEFAQKISESIPGIATDYFKKMLGLHSAGAVDIVFTYEDLHQSIFKLMQLLNRNISLQCVQTLPRFKYVKHKYDYKISNALRNKIMKSEPEIMNYYE